MIDCIPDAESAPLVGDAAMSENTVRMGVDIGGTFTDLVLETRAGMVSAKVLTTYAAPEDAIIDGMHKVCAKAGIDPWDIAPV